MQAKLQLRPADAGQTIISLSVPAAKARAVAEAIKAVFLQWNAASVLSP